MSSTILVVMAWVARELGALVIRNISKRIGTVGYVPQVTGFFRTAVLEDGREVEAMYVPELLDDDSLSVTLSCRGELFNDTETPLLLGDCRVTFVHPSLPPFQHQNPAVLVAGQRNLVVELPARARVPINVEVPIPRESLSDYESRIPSLTVQTPAGRKFQFWLATVSFLIQNRAVLGRGRKPVLLQSIRAV